MMDTDEVIVVKVMKNVGPNDKSNEQISHVTENKETTHAIEDGEVILIDKTTVVETNSNEKSNTNEQEQKSCEDLNTNENEALVENDNKQCTNNSSKENDDNVPITCEDSTTVSVKSSDKLSSLTAIAVEYGSSDSETEDGFDLSKEENDQVILLKEVQMQPYRLNKEASSSSEESDSEDDSTSSSDSSVIVESNESDSDDGSKKKPKGNSAREQKNNEMKSELDDLPPIEDLKISVPEVLCDILGEVAWMVEQLVVVRPKPGKPTLNLDTVLFVEKGQRALGKIFDVFGQVNEPHYCVRFNSSEHIQECDVKVGMTVYYCPNTEYTSLVFLHELMKIKGIDASADEPPEFSDDEEERVYYEKLKAQQASKTTETDVPSKRKRATSPSAGWQSNHPWNRNAQRHRRGHYRRMDQRQFPSMQNGNQSQNLWLHNQSNWSSVPGGLHLESSDQYGYGMYPAALQPMHYMNPNVNSQNFYGLDGYYNENGTGMPLNPRVPFNACPRIPAGHLSLQNRANSFPNIRYRNSSVFGQPQMPQAPPGMNMPWVSLPPPPPPPPSSSSGTS